MNVLSLFDGISCGMEALDRANIKVNRYYASEIDSVAIGISKYNWENIIRLGDVRKIDINKLPKIDLLIGGSPCQGFSRAGIGLNFEDPRSRLFFDYIKILDQLEEKNPDIKFLLENVKMKTEWSNIITDYIGVDPIEINSIKFTPQNRERLYWTNINIAPIKAQKRKLSDILENVEITDFIEKDGIKIDKSFSDNSINLLNVVNGELRIKQSTKAGYIVAHEGDGINLSFPTSKSRRGRVLCQKSSCIDTACNIGVYSNGCIRRFTITELEKLQTLPEGYTEYIYNGTFSKVSDQQRKQVIGNGWTVDVIAHILKGL